MTVTQIDAFDPDIFCRSFDAFVQFDTRVGGEANVWEVTSDGITQIWPRISNEEGHGSTQ